MMIGLAKLFGVSGAPLAAIARASPIYAYSYVPARRLVGDAPLMSVIRQTIAAMAPLPVAPWVTGAV